MSAPSLAGATLGDTPAAAAASAAADTATDYKDEERPTGLPSILPCKIQDADGHGDLSKSVTTPTADGGMNCPSTEKDKEPDEFDHRPAPHQLHPLSSGQLRALSPSADGADGRPHDEPYRTSNFAAKRRDGDALQPRPDERPRGVTAPLAEEPL